MEPSRSSSRYYLLSQPRSASNLLVRMLALNEQSSVAKWHELGYFFLHTIWDRETIGPKAIEKMTQEEKTVLRASYQKGADEFERYLAAAEKEGKTAFVKEHCFNISDPTVHDMFHSQHIEHAGLSPSSAPVGEEPWTVQLRGEGYGTSLGRSQLNKTIFPDAFLQTWHPIILIRHPALMFPSMFRAEADLRRLAGHDGEDMSNMNADMTLYWARSHYDYFADHFNKTTQIPGGEDDDEKKEDSIKWPLVIDADDIITEPEVVTRLAEITNLDISKVKFSWDETGEGEKSQQAAWMTRMKDTLQASTGILRNKAATNIDISEEAKKWKVEFGGKYGELMEKWVRDAMPDYEFLRCKRLRPKLHGAE
ncbi:hypothetical protein AJ80_00480 [Polytolypa hystricis UAMH7299]|uniref:Sulfotransferase domain-containing protein n=1 Tax=Polytolypa hystricis (strain UAMH7299) TaxID=1447883 RepID=A0A2B7Z3E6_POLH7|nr:hypothetical protein AJ80_00480 [Polytolypa hystricis UAMH7299]